MKHTDNTENKQTDTVSVSLYILSLSSKVISKFFKGDGPISGALGLLLGSEESDSESVVLNLRDIVPLVEAVPVPRKLSRLSEFALL